MPFQLMKIEITSSCGFLYISAFFSNRWRCIRGWVLSDDC